MEVKRFLKQVAARTCASLLPQGGNGRVVVLCYHSIHPNKAFSSASPERFREHLQWLKQYCTVVPFEDIPAQPKPAAGEKPVVAITFDDGYADNYEYAFPLLEEAGLSATFFLTLGLMEKDAAVLDRFETQRQTPRRDVMAMEWPQAREMASAGMTLGAHTYSHPNLAQLPRGAAFDELRRSREMMEDRLGLPVTTMAYPYGKPNRAFTAETEQLAAEAGYSSAAAVLFRGVRPDDSPLAVPRFFVWRDDLPTLAEKIDGAWDLIGYWQEHLPRSVARLVSPHDFLPEQQVRQAQALVAQARQG